MKHWTLIIVCTVLTACAGVAPVQRADHLLADELFTLPAQAIRAEDVFALSDAMRDYAGREMHTLLRQRGQQQGLVDALYSKGRLKLEYDAALTRNAAQAFEARAGNCLSLVIMTAAFAKHLGMPVRYQSVLIDDTWSREGDLYLASSHVNISLAKRAVDARVGFDASHLLTIDFLPPDEVRGHRTRDVTETTIVAMYMNNRAVESLTRGQLDEAYAWARAAVLQDPGFLRAFNTLAVIYLRHGNLAHAERALQHVLGSEPANTQALSNLVRVLQAQGLGDDAALVSVRLARIEPFAPFYFYNLGRVAMRAGDYRRASELFGKEVDRAAYHHEFHFWLALAQFGLGEYDQANRHLALAKEYSPTRVLQDRYAAKLEHLRSYRAQ